MLMNDDINKKMLDELPEAASEIKGIEESQPSKKLKLFFWIILGCLSVFFAEVISGSDMFLFFNPWGIIAIIPLYTLHILVLSHLVFKQGRPNIYTLFLAGAIFGMYEAYITKVLWSPPWNESTAVKIGGVGIVEIFLLVFFWHAFMAFIIPLFVAENVLTNSREIMYRQPERIQTLFNTKKKSYLILILFAAWAGIFQSMNSPDPLSSMISGLSTTGLIGILIFIWRKWTKGRNYSIYDLLPDKKGFKLLLSLLIAYYIVTGIYLRPEALPDIFSQMTIWVFYVIFFTLLYFNLKKSKDEKPNLILKPAVDFSWKLYILLSLIFTFSSAISIFIPIVILLFGGFGLLLG